MRREGAGGARNRLAIWAAGRTRERAVALEADSPGFKAQFYSKTKNVAHHLVLQESSH